MACRSASVQRAEEKSETALVAIKNLGASIENLAIAEKKEFESKIAASQAEIGVDDFEKLEYNAATKVDFTKEFDAAAMVPVIENVLKTAATLITATAPGAALILIQPENIKTYADLLGSIAEAIKTRSTTGATSQYSVNRLAPGFFAFTWSKSMTITDKDTFGEESITAVNFQYALYFSPKHAARVAGWEVMISILELIRKIYEARIGLVNQLASGKFTMEEFATLSEKYREQIAKFEAELAAHAAKGTGFKFAAKGIKGMDGEKEYGEALYEEAEASALLSNATNILESKGPQYAQALQEAKDLLTMVQKR